MLRTPRSILPLTRCRSWAGGGALRPLADVTLGVPETATFKVQELHVPLYHALCAMLEAHFFA